MERDEREGELPPDAFVHLLERLGGRDQKAGARKYEHIRRGLIEMFARRGRPSPEELADEVINRMMRKLLKDHLEGVYIVIHLPTLPETSVSLTEQTVKIDRETPVSLTAQPVKVDREMVDKDLVILCLDSSFEAPPSFRFHRYSEGIEIGSEPTGFRRRIFHLLFNRRPSEDYTQSHCETMVALLTNRVESIKKLRAENDELSNELNQAMAKLQAM